MKIMEYRIIKHIAVLGKNKFGFKELNIVRWFDHDAKFDIRIWTTDHEHFKGGLTLTYQELKTSKEALVEWFSSEEATKIAKNKNYSGIEASGLDEVMQNVVNDLIKRVR